MLEEMTPTLKQSRQLVKVLLKELQNLQKKFQNLAKDETSSIMDDEVYNENEEIEILDNEFSADKFEKCSMKDNQFEEESQKILEVQNDFAEAQ